MARQIATIFQHIHHHNTNKAKVNGNNVPKECSNSGVGCFYVVVRSPVTDTAPPFMATCFNGTYRATAVAKPLRKASEVNDHKLQHHMRTKESSAAPRLAAAILQ